MPYDAEEAEVLLKALRDGQYLSTLEAMDYADAYVNTIVACDTEPQRERVHRTFLGLLGAMFVTMREGMRRL